MSERIAQLEKGWSKGLIPLLSVVVPYEVVAKMVGDGLMTGDTSWHRKPEKKHGL